MHYISIVIDTIFHYNYYSDIIIPDLYYHILTMTEIDTEEKT